MKPGDWMEGLDFAFSSNSRARGALKLIEEMKAMREATNAVFCDPSTMAEF
jgi:hypothetical protein